MDVDEDEVCEETIKANLDMFLPYICDCLMAKDLLVHLTYFSREQRKEIFKLSVRRSHDATRQALEIVRHATDEPGRFVALLEAMRIAEYPKIAKILAGKHTPCDQNCQKIVDLFTHELTGRLKPRELLPLLKQHNVIGQGDSEEILAEEINHGRSRANWLLLYYLPCREKNWFKYFLLALMQTEDFKDLPERLDPDLHEKLVIQQQESEDTSLATLQEESLSLIYARSADFALHENILSDYEPAQPDDKVASAPGGSSDNTNTGREIGAGTIGKAKAADQTNVTGAVSEDRADDLEQMKLTLDLLEDFSDLKITDNKKCNTEERKAQVNVANDAGTNDSNDLGGLAAAAAEDTVVEKDTIEDTKEHTRPRENRDYMGNGKEVPIPDTGDKTRIKYTREFLLELRDSPLSQSTPKEATKFPEIQLNRDPRVLPRRNFNHHNPKFTPAKWDNRIGNPRNIPEDDETYVKSVETFDSLLPNAEDNTKLKCVQYASDETYVKHVTADEANINLAEDFDSLLPSAGTRADVKMAANPEANIKQDEDFDNLLPGASARADIKKAADPAGAAGGEDDDSSDDDDDLRKLLLDDLKAEKRAADDTLNDLSAETETNRTSNENMEVNIKTDEDEIPGVVDRDIELRNYQRELARDGCEGENIIVMAPTNSGKTRVACAIMQAHLRRCRREKRTGRVVFIVENETLAGQQGKVCAIQLPAYRTKVISGSVQRDKQQYLKDFIHRRDILVVTAQVLVNALRDEELTSVAVFSLVVFDECHHTNSLHPYNQIMSRYMDLKLNKNNHLPLPQVIGLTASIGVGGSTNVETAMKHMKQILSNMDASYLSTVRQNVQELRQFENPPIEETVTVDGREIDVFKARLDDCMVRISNLMANHPSIASLDERDTFILGNNCTVPDCHGTEQFLQWLSDFRKAIGELSSHPTRRVLNPCRHHLEVYNKALMMHRDARVHEARTVLEVYMQDQIEENTVKDDTDTQLLDIYTRVENIDYDSIPENPKLLKLEELILNVLQNDPNARGIIFVKTRELARALITWTRETPILAPLNATSFVGQVASASEGGMTKSDQKDILEYFKDGRHKLIIATSVAEEGLDIAKCNLVIRYEHVTNEIVRLQSRGRARADISKYYVLTETGSWIAAKEEKNALLEQLMKQLVPVVQHEIEGNQNTWHREMLIMQRHAKELERLKEQEMLEKQAALPCHIQCMNCSKFICRSTDIRKIQNAHHVVITDDIKDRIVTRRSPHPKFVEEELKYDGDIYCLGCTYSLGGVCEYKTVEFPLLKVKRLRVEPENGNGDGFNKKKWKDVPFYVETFTLDDLRLVVERKLEEHEQGRD